jgi:hypothetical protein
MATIKFGAIITDARGKLNGNQLSRNRAGSILQGKCQQRKGGTQLQTQFSSIFSTVARYWRSLTEVEQTANNTASSAYPYTDKYGDTRYYTGYQLLLRSNLNRAVSGLAPINEVPGTPPAGYLLTSFTSEFIVTPGISTDGNISWSTPGGFPTDYLAQIFIGNQVSAGVNNYTGSTIFVESIDAGLGTYDFFSASLPQLLSYQVGNVVFIFLYVIHAPSGIQVGSYTIKTPIN